MVLRTPAPGCWQKWYWSGRGYRWSAQKYQQCSHCNDIAEEKLCYPVPEDIDKQVARMKLDAMGVGIVKLTAEQEEYLAGWSEGT
jgi:S-adenosylhomocysteine hydrolase